jgi:C-terminal peptidase prc
VIEQITLAGLTTKKFRKARFRECFGRSTRTRRFLRATSFASSTKISLRNFTASAFRFCSTATALRAVNHSDTPADKAGLHYGDRFLEIEGKDARKYTSAEVSKNVRGERGTTVNIKIERAGQEKPLEFNIVRGGVPLPSIRNYFMLKDGVGYVGFTGGFQETSADELDEAIGELKKQGMKSLVLDLRGNPGGLLPQAIEVVSRFVPRGQTVVSGQRSFALRSIAGTARRRRQDRGFAARRDD